MKISCDLSAGRLRSAWLQTELAQLMARPPAERLGELLIRMPQWPTSDWLHLVGALWDSLPRIAGWDNYLLRHTPLGHAPWPVVEMMNADELAAYIDLPDEFLVYRGALAHNHAGICWSLGREHAAVYADRYAQQWDRLGHRHPTAYRLTALADKSQVVAVKQIKDELTVLVAQVDYLGTEVLPIKRPCEPSQGSKV